MSDNNLSGTAGATSGRVIVPVNKLELLAPWLGLVAVASLAALTFAFLVRAIKEDKK